jgi:hypothetical protein
MLDPEFKVKVVVVLTEVEKGVTAISDVFANIPRAYLEFKELWSETEHDESGEPTITTLPIGPHERELYPFLIYPLAQESKKRPGPDECVPDEFEAVLAVDREVKTVLILNAKSLDAALARIRETYPDADVLGLDKRTWSEHPVIYLDNECLVCR